jgi:hypothetical protein
MQVSDDMVRRHFLCLLLSGGSFLAGCGSSENKLEVSAETRKGAVASKIGDVSKFVKPGKGRVRSPR